MEAALQVRPKYLTDEQTGETFPVHDEIFHSALSHHFELDDPDWAWRGMRSPSVTPIGANESLIRRFEEAIEHFARSFPALNSHAIEALALRPREEIVPPANDDRPAAFEPSGALTRIWREGLLELLSADADFIASPTLRSEFTGVSSSELQSLLKVRLARSFGTLADRLRDQGQREVLLSNQTAFVPTVESFLQERLNLAPRAATRFFDALRDELLGQVEGPKAIGAAWGWMAAKNNQIFMKLRAPESHSAPLRDGAKAIF